MSDPRALGVFDSGVGGLTVARAIIDLLPREPIVYFGDTARYPYGDRPVEQIRGFAREIAAFLLDRDVKMLVVACNSIEVAAIEELTDRAGVPVVGVIDAGVRAALHATRSGRVGVIGTTATIESGAYHRAVNRERADIELVSEACPAFVPHVEGGDTTSDELLELAKGYLAPLQAAAVDTLILGCTHYPLLSGLLQVVMGPEVVLISSAEEVAKDVYRGLVDGRLLRDEGDPPHHEFLCSGDPSSFRSLTARFLGPEATEVHATSVELAPLSEGGTWS
ncbi:MAG: glutamate racemase [Actinomycetota bacterium]|nr:glutamate racemase [Actinomycetota bacterium]